MEETKKRKYAHLAMQFSLYILAILVVSFVLQNIFIVKSVKAYSQRDYSDFSEKVIAEDAGKIQNWNEVLVNDLRIYSDNDVTKAGNADRIIAWLLSHENIRNIKLFFIIHDRTEKRLGNYSQNSSVTCIANTIRSTEHNIIKQRISDIFM